MSMDFSPEGDLIIESHSVLRKSFKSQPIGIWGQRHNRCLNEHNNTVYTTGRLNSYLAEVNKQPEEMECDEKA